MSVDPNVLKIRSKLLAALDKKLKKDPIWQAFREADNMFVGGLNGAARDHTANEPLADSHRSRAARGKAASGKGIGDLGVAAITEASKPVTTDKMVEYVGSKRHLTSDAKRARVNVQSAMSHDSRITNIKWRGGTAWWLKDRELPKED
jgi:hypothetical protein